MPILSRQYLEHCVKSNHKRIVVPSWLTVRKIELVSKHLHSQQGVNEYEHEHKQRDIEEGGGGPCDHSQNDLHRFQRS